MSEAAQTLTVRVPFASRKRGGRKLAIAADGNTLAPPAATDRQHARQGARARPQVEWTSGKRALWICRGRLAAAETINPSYVSRVLRLTLLAPDIVEAVVEGRQVDGVEVALLLQPFSVAWNEQRRALP